MPQILRWSYLALVVWQAAWMGFLPDPWGPELGLWGLVIASPLLLTLRGVWSTNPHGINWASYLLILYFMLGVAEAWTVPGQRSAALAQLVLVCTCLVSIVAINLKMKRLARNR